MNQRYKVVSGSVSAHCCFVASVMDEANPDNDEAVCETYYVKDAELIANALNAFNALKTPNPEQ